MVRIIYVEADGSEKVIEGKVGETVMLTALTNDIEGIVGECCGAMMCATCHVYVDGGYMDKIARRTEEEEDMLDCAESEIRHNSRLSCQIKVSPEIDGLKVRIPKRQ